MSSLKLTRPRLSISFSGGRTSAYMTKRLVEELRGSEVEVAVLFCNTGAEAAATLDFVHRCDQEWGLGVVWLEADVNPVKGAPTLAKVTNYEAASRRAEPFEAFIRKMGIPNMSRPKCTTYLKLMPMEAYRRRVLGWEPRSYHTAVGIRADEVDRMNPGAEEAGLIYPLVEWGVRKKDVLAWWAAQPWGLDLPEHYGNCTWCWKKTDRKLFTLAQDDPSLFDFPLRMEQECGMAGTTAQKSGKPQTFYRKNRSARDILEAAARFPRTDRYVDHAHQVDDRPFLFQEPSELDLGSACGESCEVGADDADQDWMSEMGWLQPGSSD